MPTWGDVCHTVAVIHRHTCTHAVGLLGSRKTGGLNAYGQRNDAAPVPIG
jgi:hypothetical protein